MALCIRYENAKCKECILPCDPKLTCYNRYAYLNKTYNICDRNQMLFALNWEFLNAQIKKLENEKDVAITKFYACLARLKK